MFRIDDPTAAAALPAPEAAGTPGYFTEGSPGSVSPTLVRASFLNMLQEEFIAVCVAAGIAPSKTTYNQLLTALRSAGVFTTPAQFDASTKVATMAALKAAGFQFSTITSYSTTGTMAPAVGGQLALLTAAGATTQTLPLAASVPTGTAIFVQSISATAVQTIARQGADVIFMNGGTSVTSVALNNGDSLILVSNGGSNWSVVGGSAQLGYSGAFGASLAANGYQKLPSGLILQWGTSASIGPSGASVTITFPITFPTAARAVLITPIGYTGASSTPSWVSTVAAANFILTNQSATTQPFHWVAIGN